MIYTRFGSPIKIVGAEWEETDFGNGKKHALWVQAEYIEDGASRDFLVSDLKADGGWAEISDAIEAVEPEIWGDNAPVL